MSMLLKFNNALLLLVNVYLPPSQNRSQFSSLWTEFEAYIITPMLIPLLV